MHPIIQRLIGMIIIELSVKPLLPELIIEINITEETIVAGTDFFLMPKNSGISPIPIEVTALSNAFLDMLIISDVVIASSVKLIILLSIIM